MLLAPVRMLFHTQFIAGALLGLKLQLEIAAARRRRNDAGAKRCAATALHTLLGLGWLALVYWLNPSFLWWLLPVAGALSVSIPISVLSSRVSLGRSLRAERLFLIPEESYPPRVLRRMRRYFRHAPRDAGLRRCGRRSAAQRDRVRGRRRAHAAFGCDAARATTSSSSAR